MCNKVVCTSPVTRAKKAGPLYREPAFFARVTVILVAGFSVMIGRQGPTAAHTCPSLPLQPGRHRALIMHLISAHQLFSQYFAGCDKLYDVSALRQSIAV